MADTVGLSTKMALYDCATWETAFPGGTGTTVNFISESLTEKYEELERKGLVGSGGAERADQGNVEVVGSTVHELDYDRLYNFLPYWFGDASSPYDISDDIVPEYYWLEFEKTVERWRFGACKLNKITLRGPQDGKIQIELEHVCRALSRVATAFGGNALTTTERCLFKTAQFRLADQADAIAAGDIMQIASFELSADRKMETGQYASIKAALGDAIYKIEPVPADFREILLTIELPRYAAKTLQDWKDDDEALMADLTITGSANSYLIQLPELSIREGFDATIEGPGVLKQSGVLRAWKSSNSNMYVGNEMRITRS